MLYSLHRNLVRIVYSYILRDNVKCARKLGVRIGKKCRVLDEPGAVFGSEPWLVSIGNHVEITNGVRFLTHEGALWCLRELIPSMEKADLFMPVTVGDNVMIGMRTIIMPGVSIGNNVIIGANTVVTKDVPDNTLIAGIPGRPISSMDEFVAKIQQENKTLDTKKMSQPQKKELMKKIHPEWFN